MILSAPTVPWRRSIMTPFKKKGEKVTKKFHRVFEHLYNTLSSKRILQTKSKNFLVTFFPFWLTS